MQKETVNARPTKLSPKEWQKHHDSWLNSVVWTAIGKDNPPYLRLSCPHTSVATGT